MLFVSAVSPVVADVISELVYVKLHVNEVVVETIHNVEKLSDIVRFGLEPEVTVQSTDLRS
jgi:hypothetical protein